MADARNGDPFMDDLLQGLEKSSFGQQRDRQKQRKQKIIFGILVPRFTHGESAHFGQSGDTCERDEKSRERREKQRHRMVDRVRDQERDKRDQRERADLLRLTPPPGRIRNRRIDDSSRFDGAAAVPCRIQDIMAVERAGQLFTDEMTQELLSDRWRYVFMDERDAQRLTAAQALGDGIGSGADFARVPLDQKLLRKGMTLRGEIRDGWYR